jgi:Ribosomal protein L10
MSKQAKKVVYDQKLVSLLEGYSKLLIAIADNVGSNQMQNIRKGLRGDSVLLMGKNTLIRRCVKQYAQQSGNTDYLNLIPLLAVCSFLPSFLMFFFCLFVGIQVNDQCLHQMTPNLLAGRDRTFITSVYWHVSLVFL